MQALDKYINEIKTLPPAPRVLSQLLMLLNQPDVHASQIVELITFDPALTAKVLQRCNNAAFGLASSVSNLDEAVTLVGFNAIYRLVAMVVGESLLSAEQEGYGIGRGELWEHSVTSAVAARVLARKLGGEENLVFANMGFDKSQPVRNRGMQSGVDKRYGPIVDVPLRKLQLLAAL